MFLCSCLRNVVALFHVLGKEMEWRRQTGRPEGFEAIKTYKPIVAIGPEHALEESELVEDGFRMLSLYLISMRRGIKETKGGQLT